MRIKFSLLAMGLLGIASISRADSLNQVAQQIRDNSALPLHQGVARVWAGNLLAAQDPTVCSYCASEADSLPLSIAAVLRAVMLEQTLNGLTYCDRSNCFLPNIQSTIAIDDRVSITLTPDHIDFGAVPVVAPEPEVWILMLIGLGAFSLSRRGFAWLRESHDSLASIAPNLRSVDK